MARVFHTRRKHPPMRPSQRCLIGLRMRKYRPREPGERAMRLLVEYARQFGRFQRNARLYLINNALSGVTTGILLVLYNLYLISLGYGPDFVGLVLFVGTIGAGIA